MTSRDQRERVISHFGGAVRYWTQIYESPDLEGLIYRSRKSAALELVDSLDLAGGARVLEAGCGGGSMSVALAQRGYDVEAIDVAADMLDETERLAQQDGVGARVQARIGDLQELEYPDNTFRLVLALGVLPWLDAPRQAIREASRVLTAGGHLILSADNRWRLTHLLDPVALPRSLAASALRRIGGNGSSGAPRWKTHSIRELDSELGRAGLKKLKGVTVGFGPYSFLGFRPLPAAIEVKMHQTLLALADRGVPLLRSIGSHYLVLAQKIVNAG